MPKIEVNRNTFYKQIGKKFTQQKLIDILETAKGELDEVLEEEGILKIELNDTNRPDLWSSLGLARHIRTYLEETRPVYKFFSAPKTKKPAASGAKGKKPAWPAHATTSGRAKGDHGRPGAHGLVQLLRNDQVTGLSPLSPSLGSILPLDPVDDLHVACFPAGGVDAEPTGGSPLVLYAVDASVTLRLAKTPAGATKIGF